MLRSLIAAALVLAACSVAAEARPKAARVMHAHPDCNVVFPCDGVITSPRGERVVKAMGGFGVARKIYQPRAEAPRRVRKARSSRAPAPVERIVRQAGIALVGIVAPLAAKVAEIQASCGSRVVSAVRHTVIAGTRRISLHASGKAVDLAGNPGCIYAQLAGWPGGYSIDYGRVAHVHLSYDVDGRREWGLRFRHGAHRHRYAHRRHQVRQASAR